MEKDLLISSNDYKKEFARVAENLLKNYFIEIMGKKYSLCEIEIYFRSEDHDDPFVHCSEEQKTPCKFYFHKTGNSYKGGTFKGLDITFGKKDTSYGGILIRSIKINNNLIEGSCNCVNEILKVCDKNNVKQLVEYLGDLDVFNSDKLRLVKHNPNNSIIYTGPRVGLTLKKSDGERLQYIMKRYRYLTEPDKIKKYKRTINYDKDLDKEDISGFDPKMIKNYNTKEIIKLYKFCYNKGYV